MILMRRYKNHSPRVSKIRQRGMSLVELMIAMVLSLIVVAALAELFVNMTRSAQEMAKTNSQIENARFAMQYMRNDIVHAGYWGGFLPEFDDLSILGNPGDEPTLVPDPCRDFDDWDNQLDDDPFYTNYRNAMLAIPIDVRENMPADCSLAQKVADTDVLIVRHANTCAVGDASCEAQVAGDLYIQVSNCENDTERYVMDPNTPAFSLRQRDCSAGAEQRKFMQNIYYVRNWSNSMGDGVPSLVRSRLEIGNSGSLDHDEDDAEVLIEGIERLRVELGIDNLSETGEAVDYTQAIDWADDSNLNSPTNRGDGVPDVFIHCGTTTCDESNLPNVVAVKLYILARANEPTLGYVDNRDYFLGDLEVEASELEDDFKRHVFSTTIRVANVSGRRETPDPNDVSSP